MVGYWHANGPMFRITAFAGNVIPAANNRGNSVGPQNLEKRTATNPKTAKDRAQDAKATWYVPGSRSTQAPGVERKKQHGKRSFSSMGAGKRAHMNSEPVPAR